MNFKAIAKFFGARVHVWGCSSWTDFNGRVHDEFLATKKLSSLEPIAKAITLVCQEYDNREEFYQDSIPVDVIFSKEETEESAD